MHQPSFKQVHRRVWAALLVLAVLLAGDFAASQASPRTAMTPTVNVQVLDVNCISLPAVTPTYAKLTDLGTFTVNSPDSTVELVFNGRIFVGSFASGTGAVFELRVDDAASTAGRARANLRAAQAGGGGVQSSILGYFTGLSAGEHTASIWVRTSTGGAASQAMVDPGCWSTDVLVVKEYAPFGATFLPSLSR